jgi:hypothetical protein
MFRLYGNPSEADQSVGLVQEHIEGLNLPLRRHFP